ncbi:hypothetical protein [Burkholderia sp. BDU5]|uniref:hypothetical protein n=1 Tax=Burkholderia sp. BDU5 TaxID=1385590 RepID=UPI0012E3E16B|nr:hypothetical protein [Burkholderia sp. BDU5]
MDADSDQYVSQPPSEPGIEAYVARFAANDGTVDIYYGYYPRHYAATIDRPKHIAPEHRGDCAFDNTHSGFSNTSPNA